MDRVVIYAPAGRDQHQHRQKCSNLCDRQRWHVAAITHDPDTARLYVARGAADYVAVAEPWHVKDVALPVVVVSQYGRHRLPRQRRTGRRSHRAAGGT